MFQLILTDLVQAGLLRHDAENRELLRLDDLGDRLVGDFRFLAAFDTPLEFTLFGNNRRLGNLSFREDLEQGSVILFGGAAWTIKRIDWSKLRVECEPAAHGDPPDFVGSVPSVDTMVRQRMFDIYRRTDVPGFLLEDGAELLQEARTVFGAMNLFDQQLVEIGNSVMLFPWVGDQAMRGLHLCLVVQGLTNKIRGPALEIDSSTAITRRALENISEAPPSVEDFLSIVPARNFAKNDQYLRRELVARDYLSQHVDLRDAVNAASQICLPQIVNGG